jgi:hypothetical protein
MEWRKEMYKKLMLTCVVLAVTAGGMPVRAGLQDGLVAYFKFDESSGTVASDASGKGNHGTLIGPTLGWAAGYDGGALLCDTPVDAEVADRMEFPTTGMSPAAGTVAVWANLADPQPNTRGRYIFGHTGQAAWSSRLQIYMQDGSNPARFLHIGLGSSHTTAQNIVELPMEEWLHVALTWNNGAYVVYVNGLSVAKGAYTGLTDFHTVANFGNDGWNAPYEAFRGMLDEARVYSRALTADEIEEICPPSRAAKSPEPADGAVGVTTPLFRWEAGYKGVMHEVYIGTSPDLGPADLAGPRTPLPMLWYLPGLQAGVTYYWRVDEIEADQTTVNQGNVWSFTTQALTAYLPSPKDGAANASPAPTLTWQAGQMAVKHQLYFGDSRDAVTQGAAGVDKGALTEMTFSPGPLNSLTTYYWRVDEIKADASVVTGPVWSFTTVLPVEDMESYTDDEGNRIYETWIDGWSNKTGSMVGYLNAPFAEQKIVHGGKQSMPLDYNNVNAPFYSEAELMFATNQNWTADGADTLILYLRLRTGSKAAPVYVELKDAQNRTGRVVAEAAMVSATKWAEWEIPFSEFEAAGVNLSRVKTLYLGVGDKANPTKGGTGMLFVDDISLAKSAPIVP